MASAIIRQHPDRVLMEAESHSRPPLDIDFNDAQVWNWALFEDNEDTDAWPEAFDSDERHQIIKLDGGILRFERHTEFVSLTYVGKGEPLATTLDLIRSCPGMQLSGARITLTNKAKLNPSSIFGEQRLFGGYALFKGVTIATTFLSDEKGLVPYLVNGPFDDGFGRGRLVKRLIDLEIYRMMSLLALPMVRNASKKLLELETSSAAAITRLSGTDGPGLGGAIEDLADILSDVGAMQSRTRYRIAASNAYYDIVKARLDSLTETPIGQRQTLRGFIDHRLSPAMGTIEAFDRRLEQISETVRAAMALARTQLDQISQAQNQKLLASMEHRARQQVHLSQAVEGLSVAAISYYGVGLVNYALKGLPDMAINDSTIVTLSVPVIILIAFIFTRRARKHVLKIAKHQVFREGEKK